MSEKLRSTIFLVQADNIHTADLTYRTSLRSHILHTAGNSHLRQLSHKCRIYMVSWLHCIHLHVRARGLI